MGFRAISPPPRQFSSRLCSPHLHPPLTLPLTHYRCPLSGMGSMLTSGVSKFTILHLEHVPSIMVYNHAQISFATQMHTLGVGCNGTSCSKLYHQCHRNEY